MVILRICENSLYSRQSRETLRYFDRAFTKTDMATSNESRIIVLKATSSLMWDGRSIHAPRVKTIKRSSIMVPNISEGSSDLTGNYRYTFTVFTPSYNRAQTLSRVYNSLRIQTFRDFEWLVVDRSDDGTRQLIEKWQAESDFPIRYIFQEKQSLHAAFNCGVQEARGELFLGLDSDDDCVPEALERFKFHWDSIPESKKDKFSAVTGLCKDQNGNLVGDKFPSDVLDSDSIEIRFKYVVRGEKWGFNRTDVLRQFPFPTVPNAKCIPEQVVWFALSRKFKTRFVNEALRIYYIDDRAMDHLSLLSPAANYAGNAYYNKYKLDELMGWLFRSPWKLIFSAVDFSRCSFGLGKGPSSQFRELHSLTARLLVGVSLPFGFVLYTHPDVISRFRSSLHR